MEQPPHGYSETHQYYSLLVNSSSGKHPLVHATYVSNKCVSFALANPSLPTPQFPVIPIPPPSAPIVAKIYAHEASLFNDYNQAVIHLKRANTLPFMNRIISKLVHSLFNVLHVLHLLRKEQNIHIFPVSDFHPQDSSAFQLSYQISDLATCITNSLPTSPIALESEDLPFAQRWAVAAADLLDVLSASHLIKKESVSATAASSAASTLRELGAVLCETKFGRARTDKNENKADRMDITDESIQDAQVVVTQDTCFEDAAYFRTQYYKAISLVMQGQIESAASIIVPIAQAQLQNSVNDNEMTNSILYAAAVILLQHSNHLNSMKQVTQFAEKCISNSYRVPDSYSLMARATPRNWRIQVRDCWSKALSLCSDADINPPTLWLVSRAFARLGDSTSQLKILQLAKELLHRQDKQRTYGNDDEDENLNGNKILHTVQLDCRPDESNNNQKLSTMHDILKEQMLLLFLNGSINEAYKLKQMINETRCSLQEIVALASKGRLIEKKHYQGLKQQTWSEDICLMLARLESSFRRSNMKETAELILLLMKNLNPQDVADTNSVAQILRGICHYNVGVALTCQGRTKKADGMYKAAQTIFEKCANKGGDAEKDALHHADVATFGRCLTLWFSGRKRDAAVHWVEKRGLKGITGIVKNDNQFRDMALIIEEDESSVPLLTEVDENRLNMMDNLSFDVYRSMNEG